MVASRWAKIVNSLADRGIPLYMVTDPLDDAGLPSWAVLGAIVLVLVAAVAFVAFPVAKAPLDVTTTPGARVIVSYGEERLSKTATNGTAVFHVPLGSSASVTITKHGCSDESVDIDVVDSYSMDKPLVCK